MAGLWTVIVPTPTPNPHRAALVAFCDLFIAICAVHRKYLRQLPAPFTIEMAALMVKGTALALAVTADVDQARGDALIAAFDQARGTTPKQ